MANFSESHESVESLKHLQNYSRLNLQKTYSVCNGSPVDPRVRVDSEGNLHSLSSELDNTKCDNQSVNQGSAMEALECSNSSDTTSISETSVIHTSTPHRPENIRDVLNDSIDKRAPNFDETKVPEMYEMEQSINDTIMEKTLEALNNDFIQNYTGEEATLVPPSEPTTNFNYEFSMQTSTRSQAHQRFAFALKFTVVVLLLLCLIAMVHLYGMVLILKEELEQLKQIYDGYYPVAKPRSTAVIPFQLAWSVVFFKIHQAWLKIVSYFLGLFSI